MRIQPSDLLLARALARIDAIALGTALGAFMALLVFLSTIILVIRGGEVVGPTLGLLAHYYIGYTVTLTGSFVGLAYGFVTGFLIGVFTAGVYNFVIAIYRWGLQLRTSISSFFD
jgi:hypothetical protein